MREIQGDLEDKNIEIDAIRKTQQGHMVVVMNKKCNKLQELKEIVIKRIEGVVKAIPTRDRKPSS